MRIRRGLLAPTLSLVLLAVCSALLAASASTPAVPELLELRIGQLRDGTPLELDGERIASTVVLPEFYERRAFQPAWADDPAREELLATLKASAADGLDPRDYHVAAIESFRPDMAFTEAPLPSVRAPEEHRSCLALLALLAAPAAAR